MMRTKTKRARLTVFSSTLFPSSAGHRVPPPPMRGGANQTPPIGLTTGQEGPQTMQVICEALQQKLRKSAIWVHNPSTVQDEWQLRILRQGGETGHQLCWQALKRLLKGGGDNGEDDGGVIIVFFFPATHRDASICRILHCTHKMQTGNIGPQHARWSSPVHSVGALVSQTLPVVHIRARDMQTTTSTFQKHQTHIVLARDNIAGEHPQQNALVHTTLTEHLHHRMCSKDKDRGDDSMGGWVLPFKGDPTTANNN